jgi:hypothetical protein
MLRISRDEAKRAGAMAGPKTVVSAQATLETLIEASQVRLPKTAAAIEPIGGLLGRRLYAEAFTRVLDLIPIASQECNRPAVLILDEFLLLEELGLAHAFHELGKRVMTWSSSLFILSSSSPYRARMILRERLQLLFGQFELLTLDALDPMTVASWIKQQLLRLRNHATVAPFLIRWLGAYPWYLTVFLKRAQELITLNRAREFGEPLFMHTAWDVLGNAEGVLHQWCVSRAGKLSSTRKGRRALDALLHIAQGVRTATELGRRIGRASLTEALQLIVEEDLAQRNGTCWTVADPILRCWLSTVVQAQQREAVPDPTLMRQSFERYLQSLWMQWQQFDRLSFPEQVASLFHQFSEETVSLDSRTGRLPQFDQITTQPVEATQRDAYLVADSAGRRWCASLNDGVVNEQIIATFEAFCKTQHPKPSRKLLITKTSLGEHVRVLAKTANMWVWESQDLNLLARLYGHL